MDNMKEPSLPETEAGGRALPAPALPCSQPWHEDKPQGTANSGSPLFFGGWGGGQDGASHCPWHPPFCPSPRSLRPRDWVQRDLTEPDG